MKFNNFLQCSCFLHFLQQFDRCFIGSSPDQELDSMFCGQISSVYGFSDALSPQQIQAISALGPGYKVSPFEIVLFFRINVEDWKCLFEILVFFAFARQTAVFIEFEKYYSLSMWQLPVKSTLSQNYFFSYFFKLCKFSLRYTKQWDQWECFWLPSIEGEYRSRLFWLCIYYYIPVRFRAYFWILKNSLLISINLFFFSVSGNLSQN